MGGRIDMKNFNQMIENYAKLAVRLGINVQPGQILIIEAPVETAEYVRLVVKEAYELGAKFVYVNWEDEQTTKIRLEASAEEHLTYFPEWKSRGYEEMAKENAARLVIYVPNPTLLADVNPKRVSAAILAHQKAMRGFNEYTMSGKIAWSMVSVPTEAWADAVFPEVPKEERIEKLWEAIFYTTRIDQPNPIAAWEEHIAKLGTRAEFLNHHHFEKLHYTAQGTDLWIGLPEKHLWVSASSMMHSQVPFIPNMPTEEVFTMPHKDNISGVVQSTMPLNYEGQLIDGIQLTFEKGRIVAYSSLTGQEALKSIIETDDGAHFLGEVALVPHNSPISNLKTLFKNTLFDENASNHIAIGASYPTCLSEGNTMSKEELAANGANQSLTHVDFMIGSAEMNIDGITADGKVVPVFRNGNWA
jgi:aminopeptidase